MRVTRVGILGAGGMGNVHARQYRKRNDVELYVYDRNAERLSRFNDRWSPLVAASVDDLLSKVDVVDICVPTPTHHEMVLASIAAGKPTLIEKPIARTVAQAEELCTAADMAGVPLMPAHVVRFFPEYARARAAVVGGTIGTPSAVRARRGGGAPSGLDGWFMDLSQSGGVLLDLSIHDFDWLRWMLGEVKFLYSRSVALETGEGPDYALTTLTFDSGCVGHVEGTWMDPGGFRTAFDLAGNAGLLQYDSRHNVAVRTTIAAAASEGAPLPNFEGGVAETEDPYYKEIDAFLDSVRHQKPVPVTAHDGLMAVSIAEAAAESALTGKVVVPARFF